LVLSKDVFQMNKTALVVLLELACIKCCNASCGLAIGILYRYIEALIMEAPIIETPMRHLKSATKSKSPFIANKKKRPTIKLVLQFKNYCQAITLSTAYS